MFEKLYHHTDRAKNGNSVRIMFFDFSSAFNTIQPHLLVQKLLNRNIPGYILAWILNYLTDRYKYVRITSNSRHDQMTNQGHLDQISLYCVDGGHPCISNVNTAF